MGKIRTGSHPATNTAIFNLIVREGVLDKKVLDIGAGGGYMAQMLGEYLKANGKKPAEVLTACDLFPEVFGYEDIVCEKVSFFDRLPFDDTSYDIIYAIEVMEHLANPYEFIREVYRVLKPGGKFILSVPNALNLNSRVSYLFSGFFTMYGPLSFDDKDAGLLAGHIMPLNYYYLDHRMKKVGFARTDLYADKLKRSARLLYVMLNPFIRLASWRGVKKVRKRSPQLYEANKSAMALVNSKKLLCSRSCIIVGSKA